MWISEVRNAPDVSQRLLHRKTFDKLIDGQIWACKLTDKLTTDDGQHDLWLCDELLIEHKEVK